MKLHTKIFIGLLAGGLSGLAVNWWASSPAWVERVKWFDTNVAGPLGQIFLRLLLMTVVPLVFTSITLGVAQLGDIRKVGRIGVRSLAYFFLSTLISAVIGIVLVNLVRPGVGVPQDVRQQLLDAYRGQVSGPPAGSHAFGVDFFVKIVPANPIQAAANLDMLGIIFFALIFGAALTLVPDERARPLVRVLEAIGDAIAKIIGLAMHLAPYGVFGLIFVVTSLLGWDIVRKLLTYVLVVLAGLLIHGAVSLSLLVRVLGGLNPLVFWRRITASIITAFTTSSSNATLPTNITVAEEELKIPPKIAGFVLSLGSTLCHNGTALYEGVTVLFLAQLFGVNLTLGQQVIAIVLSVMTAAGTAGVPGGSLAPLMIVCVAVGIPPEVVGVVYGVERILDMSRTTLNVCGDLTAAVYVARAEGGWDPRLVTAQAGLAPAA
ncbi:MAG TPA: dicarboxylate/amino acid:cation symporter [Gemmatimonadales bacterium]|nr:dicarboxylate/amino acid:cation symporter [Gemmatimonadales bacterium]